MKAAWYEKQGPAREVLTLGEIPDPSPTAGEVRIRIAASGSIQAILRSVKTPLATEWHILASFHTVMALVE
jgi:hypothetical protein